MTEFYNLVPNAPKGRYDGIDRPYTADDVKRLRGSVEIKHTLAEMGANRLWKLINEEPFINALGALSGNQAMQMVRAGLKAIYLSGWQVAADANTASSMYPDQSLYPANAAPELAKRINKTLQRADQIETQEGKGLSVDTWFAPIVADAEAGFGGPLNAFEIMKAFIEAGAAGVHFEDQLASEKKCGHLGGKVLIPTAGPYPQPDGRTPRRRRHGHADTDRCPHRCRGRQAADLRHRRARPALRRLRCRPHRQKASTRSRTASSPASPAPSPMRPIAT